MKATAILSIIAVLSVGTAGYLVVRQQTEREDWQLQRQRLTRQLAQVERLADERLDTLSSDQRGQSEPQKLTDAAARLADIETQILEGAAQLAELESDRVVAEYRAEAAFKSLRKQVRSLTEIESDLAVLSTRRVRLLDQISKAESQLGDADSTIAKRLEQAGALEQKIAGLALHHEARRAEANATKMASPPQAADLAASDDARAKITPRAPAKPSPQPASLPEPPTPSLAVAYDEDTYSSKKRSKGLYRFKRLAVLPDAAAPADDGTDRMHSPETAADIDGKTRSDAWADEQYLMGLKRMSEGERSSGTRALNEATLAFKAVLGEWPKERDPIRWAMARNDLGYALALIGQRKGDIATLEEAATACRDALAVFKRDDNPLLWAAAQHHLGITLSGLAALKNDEILWQNAIEALKQAVAAFKEAGAEADAQKVERRLRGAYEHAAAQRHRS